MMVMLTIENTHRCYGNIPQVISAKGRNGKLKGCTVDRSSARE
jgi:hypothetical protein